jgi:hypothetical protein
MKDDLPCKLCDISSVDAIIVQISKTYRHTLYAP